MNAPALNLVHTPALGRDVYLRPGTNDERVWSDVYTAGYHVPPASMPAPRTVLDLGANVGLTAAHYCKLWPGCEVVAVEMDDENADLCRRNAPYALLARFAVSDHTGLDSYESAAPTDAYALGGELSSPTLKVVRCRTLRQVVLRWFGGDGVDFVKMDVEGAEWDVLEQTDWAPLVRNLLVELHGDELPVERGIEALRALGFDARPHPPHPQAVFATR